MWTIVTDQVAWSVSLFVGLLVTVVNPAKSWTDRDAILVEDLVGPKEPCIRLESRFPMHRGNFEVGKGQPVVKNRSCCHDLCKNGWTDQYAVWGVHSGWSKKDWVHIGTTWRIRLNCPYALALRPFCQSTLTGVFLVSSSYVWVAR